MQRKGTKPTSRCKGVRMHVTWGEIRALDLKDGAALPKNCPGVRELMFVRVHTSPACGENMLSCVKVLSSPGCGYPRVRWAQPSAAVLRLQGEGHSSCYPCRYLPMRCEMTVHQAHENGSRQIAAKCVPGMVCMHAFPVCRFVSDCRAYCLPNIAFPFLVSTISQH